MATVTSALTRIHDAEGSLTTANLPAGGAGATANTDIFLQGSQSLGRRQTDTGAAAGFLLVDAADNDCSAADVHVGVWFWCTHYGILDDFRIVFGTGTGTPTNYDSHNFPFATEYPKLGGWVRGWVDVSRTPDNSGGTGLNEAALRSFGVQLSLTGAPGGNAQNLIIDAADFTNGGAALTLAGTSGVWTDFSTADENATNQYGVFRRIGGVFNAFARVQLGTASSLVFSDSNFAIIFPQQNLVNDTFMGITIDLQHASTSITWTNGNLKSAGAKKGDLVVTGTTSTAGFNASGCVLDALRIITLTSKCTLTSCTIQNSGQITQSSAVLTGCRIAGSTAAVALLANNPAAISDCTFVSAGTGHAIEITTAGTYTFDGNQFSGYGSAGTTDAAIYNNSGGAVTLNVVGGGSTPTVRNGSGASTTVNSNISVTLTGLKNPTEVRVYLTGTATVVDGQENVTTGSFTFGVGAGVGVDIAIIALGYQNMRILNFSTTSDSTVPVSQQVDRQYANP